jgi:multidrug efflux pump subunit AcrB
MKETLRERFNISRYALKYARWTIAFWIAVAIAGLFAFSSLKYALLPDIAFPIVIVNATATTETSLVTEKLVTLPLEATLRSLNFLDIYSSSYPGQAVITVAFPQGSSLEAVTRQVKTVLDGVSLPQSKTLDVIPLDLNESPAITYAIEGRNPNLSLEELAEITQRQILPSLEQLAGVQQVNLLGDGLLREPTANHTASVFPPTLVRFNGKSAIAAQVIKRADANTLAVVNTVTHAISRLQSRFPDLVFTIAETQAQYIGEATQATIEALIGAIILAIAVIAVFLRNWQATLITALAIPLSLLGTSIVMAIAGFDLETLTLLALALVIGIIVDDAIVDIENISRHIDEGLSPKNAAIVGTDEIGLTVTASTLTIAAVFLPVALMGGDLGAYFKPFGLTVAAAVLISLLVARTLSPVLARYWLKPQLKRQGMPKTVPFTQSYRRLLAWSLAHRKSVVAIALASFIAGLALIPLIPKGFVPHLDRGEFNLIYTTALPDLTGKIAEKPLPKSNSEPQTGAFTWIDELAQSPTRLLLRRTQRVGKQLETAILDNPSVESAFTVAGIRGEPNRGEIYIKLKGDRSFTTSQVQEQIRRAIPTLSGVTTSIENILFVETGDDAPLKLVLQGDNLDRLSQASRDFRQKLAAMPELVDVKLSGDRPDLAIEHYNGRRSTTLSANLAPNTALGSATEQVKELMRSQLPSDVQADFQGDSARISGVFREFGVTLSLAIACMLFVLFLPFRRLLEPLVVGLAVPLSVVGAMFALLITQSDFGMISLIGLIFLLGLLNKNAILLMDYTNQLRERGMERREAILETGVVRLRPIVMTTASTILGMLPIALGLGAGAELRQPMAVAIIGGLLTSSLLSLIVVPVLYTLIEDCGGIFVKKISF